MEMTHEAVDAFEHEMRDIESRLEKCGRDICDARDGQGAWAYLNQAVSRVQDAIREAWRMRPLALLLAVTLAAFTARADILDDPIRMQALFDAIAQVESDRGATSENIYQLRRIYFDDLKRIYQMPMRIQPLGEGHFREVSYDEVCRTEWMSRWAMRLYWMHYGRRYATVTGKPLTAEVLARMHNGGPNGWKKRATISYWRRVRRTYERNIGK